MREKERLLTLGAELYCLGFELATARVRLGALVEDGVPYDSDDVTAAALRLQFLQAQWTDKEAEYLRLRESLCAKNDKNFPFSPPMQ